MILLIAFFIALLISFLFMIEYKSNSTAATIVFFVILFMAGIASQYWITPFGPILWGVAFFPVLIVVLIFTFLLFIPPMHYRVSRKRDIQEDNSAIIYMAPDHPVTHCHISGVLQKNARINLRNSK